MIIRLNALQIAQFWSPIKYSLQQTERIGLDISREKFNEVFASLMCDKSQCLISYHEDKISAIMIIEVLEDRITKERILYIRSLYVFNSFSIDKWQENFDWLKKIVVSEKCNKIIFKSLNNKLLRFAKSLGFYKIHSTMEYIIGD